MVAPQEDDSNNQGRLPLLVAEPDEEDSFSACLFFMDDNHFLAEWLAYHYTVLPLRRLIVTVDRKSQKSPLEILERFKGLINITIVDLEEFYPEEMSIRDYWKINMGDFTDAQRAANKVMGHRSRQNEFQLHCLRTLRAENWNWVTNVDTDERIIIDYKYATRPPKTIRDRPYLNSSCLNFPRYHFGSREEEDESKLFEDFPSNTSLSPLSLATHRWRYRASMAQPGMNGKSTLGLKRCADCSIDKSEAHMLLFGHCPKNLLIAGNRKPFVVNHYPGTLKQFSLRADPRKVMKSTTEFERIKQQISKEEDVNAREWLADFIDQVGLERAEHLLAGVGELAEKSLTPKDDLFVDISNYTESELKRIACSTKLGCKYVAPKGIEGRSRNETEGTKSSKN